MTSDQKTAIRARLHKAITHVMDYRQHAIGCGINQTDFCGCGLREAIEELDSAWKAEGAALDQCEQERDAVEAEAAGWSRERATWRKRAEAAEASLAQIHAAQRPFVRYEVVQCEQPKDGKPARYRIYGLRENGIKVELDTLYLRDHDNALNALQAAFCEAHQPPHATCPCCEAVRADDELRALHAAQGRLTDVLLRLRGWDMWDARVQMVRFGCARSMPRSLPLARKRQTR